jgi:hypothetical protein
MGDDNLWTAGYGQAVAQVTAQRSARRINNGGTVADLTAALDAEIGSLDEQYSAFGG